MSYHPDRLPTLIRADDLQRLAVAARDEALARDRATLDAKWTWWRPTCNRCGAKVVVECEGMLCRPCLRDIE